MKTLALAAVLAFSGGAMADVLLTLDLSVTDQITITATDGFSAVTTTGSDGIGLYFADFWGGDGSCTSTFFATGDELCTAENASDGGGLLYRSGTDDPGLNFFGWTDDTSTTFTAGSLAFTGSTTWTLSPETYANMISGASSGDLYFPADDVGDLPSAMILGTYEVFVPAPGALALLGIAGLARRRRR